MFQQQALTAEMGKLGKFALRLTKNMSSAEDLLQTTLLRALEKNALFESGTNLFSWSSRIMYNLFVTGYRHRSKFESRHDPSALIDGLSVEQSQESHTDLGIVNEKMRLLNPGHREILMLVCVRGLDYAEVSEKLGIPVGTVRSRLSRAREHLRILLSPAACAAAAGA